ncbi:MAG: alpha/beta hydrolase [Thiohalobacteraceae bacterium]
MMARLGSWILALVCIAGTVQAENVQLQHGDLTLNANLAAAQEGWQDGPVLLITHGTLGHNGMEIIATLQDLFAEQAISSLAITLSLGLDDREGMYDCAVPHTHQHTDALDEIGLWRDWLKTQGVREIILVGHSRGGNQTAWFAAERPEPAVRGVVLIAPATWSEAAANAEYRQRYATELAAVLTSAQQRVDTGKGDTWLEPTGFLYCADAQVQARTFTSYYTPDHRLDTPILLGDIDVPVLVIAGSADEVVPDVAEKVGPLADGQRIRLEVIEGADHFFRDLYADDVVEAARSFIDTL